MSAKVERVAFIYLDPKPRDAKPSFAQCESCRMFVKDIGRCVIHGSAVPVGGGDSCGFYVDWPTKDGSPNPKVVSDHRQELLKGIPGSVTKEESGLVDNHVQCRNCHFFYERKGECGLYDVLNKALPHVFACKVSVTPNSCCNAWTEKE